MSEKRRKTIRIAGIALVVAAFCLIGYSVYGIVSAQADAQSSLTEAEQFIADADAHASSTGAAGDPALSQDGSQSPVDSDTLEASDAGPSGGDETAGMQTNPPKGSGPAKTGKPGGSPGSGGSGGDASSGPTASPRTDVLGVLVFNSLGGRKVSVREGVTDHNLSRGAAHHPNTSPPGGVGNCVIFGHRDTVFRGFGKLKAGDKIQLVTPGEIYTYVVKSTAVVDPSDPRIWQAYGSVAMTLVTCYPFNYVGSAPKRYIVVAVLQ